MVIKYRLKVWSMVGVLTLTFSTGLYGDEVKILGAVFKKTDRNQWSVSVSLKHADTGWEHYADQWRIVDQKGTIVGRRVLLHPHVDEQPFTRSLAGIVVPTNTTVLYVEAHDKVHGWAKNRLKLELNKAADGMLEVKAAGQSTDPLEAQVRSVKSTPEIRNKTK